MAINLDHVTEQITVTDTAANASLTVNPKGTGAFNVAAGSGGLNLSNGGTVAAITRTVAGGGYTGIPSVAVSAPTTAGGVQATVTTTIGINAATIANGGTGYSVNDVVTLVGGTFVTVASQFTVTSVSGGVVTGITASVGANYTAFPTQPAATTGGTGTGLTLSNLSGFVPSNGFTITNAGSGYVEQPTVTFSGGGGSGAAAYATVGGDSTIRALGQVFNLATDNGIGFRVITSGQASSAYWQALGTGSTPILRSSGSTSNSQIHTSGTGGVFLGTQGGVSQFAVTHTASAVNYVQSTGAATGAGPTISAQGSDTNADLNFTTKGTGVHKFNSGGGQVFATLANSASPVNSLVVYGSVNSPQIRVEGASAAIDLEFLSKSTGGFRFFTQGVAYAEQFRIANTTSSVNYLQLTGSSTGNAPYFIAQGSDTNVPIAYSARGTGSHDFYTNGFLFVKQFVVAHTASAVNFVQVTGAATGGATTISSQGSDATVSMLYSAKGSAAVHQFRTNGFSNIAFQITAGASAVNYINVNGAATGGDPVLSAQGSDTNIDLVLQPKGTGALQAQLTDSTATGGNARGANAVDFQTSRIGATQVASGSASFLGGGRRNTASSQDAFLGSGYQNISSGGNQAVVVGGANNTTSANNTGFIGGGTSNTVSGDFSSIVGGYLNTTAGTHNFIGGGYQNSGTSASSVTTQSGTMNGTTAVTLSGSNASIKVGQLVTGTSISYFPNTYVAAISGTSLTLSQVASGSSTSTLSFYTPHGVVVGGGNNTATGSYSFIGGGGDAGTAGNRNVASGDWSVVGGGLKNQATAEGSFVGGGGTYGIGSIGGNSAISQGASVVGGFNNVASGFISFVGGGNSNIANGQYSFIGGGAVGITRSIQGNHVFPAHNAPVSFVSGSSQAGLLILGKETTNATPTVLVSGGSTAGTTNQVILPNNSAYFFTGEVVAGVTGGGNTKGWTIEGVIKRGANAASTALVGTPTVTSTYADAGASTWVIAVTADTTNGGLAVTFTGQASTTIRTVCQIRTTEMTY